jgi:hypothetical protein
MPWTAKLSLEKNQESFPFALHAKDCPRYGLAKFKSSQVSSSGYLKTPQPGLDLASVIVCCIPIVLPLDYSSLSTIIPTFNYLWLSIQDRLSVLFIHASTMNLFGGYYCSNREKMKE